MDIKISLPRIDQAAAEIDSEIVERRFSVGANTVFVTVDQSTSIRHVRILGLHDEAICLSFSDTLPVDIQ